MPCSTRLVCLTRRSDPAKAWTWEQFVAAAQKITVDTNGKHPVRPALTPIKFGPTARLSIKAMRAGRSILSYSATAGRLSTRRGRALLLDSPEATEAMQNLADLMWVQHVTPTPQQDQNLPGYVTMLQTGNLAMHISRAMEPGRLRLGQGFAIWRGCFAKSENTCHSRAGVADGNFCGHKKPGSRYPLL